MIGPSKRRIDQDRHITCEWHQRLAHVHRSLLRMCSPEDTRTEHVEAVDPLEIWSLAIQKHFVETARVMHRECVVSLI